MLGRLGRFVDMPVSSDSSNLLTVIFSAGGVGGLLITAFFAWLASRKKTLSDDQSAFRKDLMNSNKELQERLRDEEKKFEDAREEKHKAINRTQKLEWLIRFHFQQDPDEALAEYEAKLEAAREARKQQLQLGDSNAA